MSRKTLTPPGDAKILGIFTDSAGNVVQPKDAISTNGWAARMLMFAVNAVKEGTVAIQPVVDGHEVGLPLIDTLNKFDVGANVAHAVAFYLPCEFRKKGTHIVTFRVGNVTTEVIPDKKAATGEKNKIDWIGEYGPFKLTIVEQEEFA